EDVFIFDMRFADMGLAGVVGRKYVKAAVEIADPETAIRIRCQRGNIAVAEDGGTGPQYRFPSESMRIHAIESIAGDSEHRVARSEELAHFGQFRTFFRIRRQVRARTNVRNCPKCANSSL